MTCEVAVMNKAAVALAADSAVTLGEAQKVYYSAEKLFRLSHTKPVAVMIYGSSEMMGVPWDTVVKIYRDKLGARSFDYIEQYATDFTHFIEDDNPLFSEARQRDCVRETLGGYFTNWLRARLDSELAKPDRPDRPSTRAGRASALDAVLKQEDEVWSRLRGFPGTRVCLWFGGEFPVRRNRQRSRQGKSSATSRSSNVTWLSLVKCAPISTASGMNWALRSAGLSLPVLGTRKHFRPS